MESHWWHDQLVSSLLKPSTVEARMHASGGRSWNSLEFSRLASHMCKEHLQETRRLRLKVCDFREKWPIVQQIPTFKLVDFWTANLSWCSKVRISSDCICHIPEFYMPCCNDVVAKNPIWLVSLLLLHRVVKARSWPDCPELSSLPSCEPCCQGYSLRELSITVSTQLPSPAIYRSFMTSLSSPTSRLSPSPLNPTPKVPPCVSLVPFQSPKLRLPSPSPLP